MCTQAERLLCAVHEAKCHIERQIEASLRRRRLPLPTSNASHQTTSPPSTPSSGQGWMATAWHWLTDEAGGSSVVGSAPTATVDAWKKTVQHFQAIEENLCSVFQVGPMSCLECLIVSKKVVCNCVLIRHDLDRYLNSRGSPSCWVPRL